MGRALEIVGVTLTAMSEANQQTDMDIAGCRWATKITSEQFYKIVAFHIQKRVNHKDDYFSIN